MTAAKKLIDDKYLKNLVPLGELDAERFNKVAKRCTVKQYDTGSRIFSIGDRDNHTIYLLSGQISLIFRSGTERVITAETNQAHHALVPEQPRQATAVAKTPVSILVVDSDVLDQVLRWNETYGYEVSDIAGSEEDDNDWMTLFLQSKAFLKLRAQNIQALMMRLEEVLVKASQIILRQGDDDGYYYIVKRGRCRVTRKPTPQSRPVEIAVLGIGAGFGEEAIIMHDSRGATVTMLEDGQLMRLSRNDFTRLLAEPLIQIVDYKDAIKNQKCVFLDVRPYEDYVKDGISHSENTPLAELRAKIDTFDSHKRYVIVSNSGGKASAATFLLCQQGLDAVVLSRGLAGLPDDVTRGNGSVEDLEKIPTIDNVVSLNVSSQPEATVALHADDNVVNKKPEVDPRVNSLLSEAKQRVGKEAEKARAAENARKKSEQEVVRLKAEAEQARLEAEKARKLVETVAQESLEVARIEATKEAARLREVELGCIQAEVEEAVQQAEEEAGRAQAAEKAHHLAQEEIARLKQEMQQALERTQEEARKSTEAVRLLAEQEARRYRAAAEKQAAQEAKRMQALEQARLQAETQIERLKAEAELTRMRLEEQARISADAARTEAEQHAARLRAQELAAEQAEKERAVLKAEQEAERAAAAEKARLQAEQEIERVRKESESARILAEQRAEKKRASELAKKQIEIDAAEHRAQEEVARACAAEQARLASEAEMQGLKKEAEDARQQIENQLAAEIERSKSEQQIALVRAEELAKKQSEIDDIARKALQDTERAHRAEEARIEAEREIAKLKAEVEAERVQQGQAASLQEKAMTDAELARKQEEIEQIALRAENEAARTQAAEQANQDAQQEILRLKSEMQAATEQAQVQLAEDSRRAVAEQEALHVRAAALEKKEREIEQAGNLAQMEALRAQEAIDARLRAEAEVERLKAQGGIAQHEAQEKLRETERHASERVKREIAQARAADAARYQAEIGDAARKAREEANRAAIAEQARREAEQEIARLKQAAEQERLRAEKAIEASIKAARQNADSVRVQKLATAKARQTVKNQRINSASLSQPKHPSASMIAPEAAEPEGEMPWMRASSLRQKDYFADEPVNMDNSLLFTNIDNSSANDNSGIESESELLDMKDKPRQSGKIPELEKNTGDSSSWVSDQVMWETALGIRQDEKINHMIAPDADGSEPAKAGIDAALQPNSNRAVFSGRDTNPRLMKQASVPYVKRRHRGGLFRKTVLGVITLGVAGAAGYYYSLDDKTQIQLQLEISRVITGKSVDDLSGVTIRQDIAKDAAALVKKTQAKIESVNRPTGEAAAVTSTEKPINRASAQGKLVEPQAEQRTATAIAPRTFVGKDIPLPVEPPLPGEASVDIGEPPVVNIASDELPDNVMPALPPVAADSVSQTPNAAPDGVASGVGISNASSSDTGTRDAGVSDTSAGEGNVPQTIMQQSVPPIEPVEYQAAPVDAISSDAISSDTVTQGNNTGAVGANSTVIDNATADQAATENSTTGDSVTTDALSTDAPSGAAISVESAEGEAGLSSADSNHLVQPPLPDTGITPDAGLAPDTGLDNNAPPLTEAAPSLDADVNHQPESDASAFDF